MQSVEKTIEVDASIGSVYELWSDFANFPKFMKPMREARRLDDRHFYFRSERGGKEYETVAEMSLQIPGKRVAWRTVSGVQNSGVVSFEPHAEGKRTLIKLKMLYEPDAGWQHPEVLSERLQSHLENFKCLIETGDV